jgi:two-component sensor histidine kinase
LGQFFVDRRPGWRGAIGLCLLYVALAALVRLILGELFGPTLPFATFFPAVLISALFGGAVMGGLSIALSLPIVWWAFMPPYNELKPITPALAADFLLFIVSSLLVVWLAVVHRRLLASFAEKEQEREILAREIQHREKNILAVVFSLIRQSVTQKDEASRLIDRIKAFTGVPNPLDDSDPGAASLEAILREGMPDRVTLDGPKVLLSAPQAKALRLVFHEMTTNAVKHGALSEPNGRVTVEWSMEDAGLEIVWCEVDGPTVAAPARYNFGSRLIARTLRQLSADFEPTFPQTGYCCTIKLPMR